jgi:O-methyltransferase domain
LLRLLAGKHITYSLSAVARLGIADHIDNEPVPVAELAAKVGAHAPSLYRVMRMLASIDVFEENRNQSFSHTAISELLKTEVPGSLRYMATFWGDPWSARAFEDMTHILRTGEDGVTKAYGKNVFEVLADEPAQAENFHRGMVNVSALVGGAVTEAYDFSGFTRIADIGGGHGMLLASILRKYPHLEGVLYDLPEVVAGAPQAEYLSDMKGRVRIEAGSFFQRIPRGCDAYVLKHILHDWSDGDCRIILKLIREQLPAHGRVLLCEMVVPDETGPAAAKMFDIEMLVVIFGGKERTAEEFSRLFRSAGLELRRIVPTESPLCVLEARVDSL